MNNENSVYKAIQFAMDHYKSAGAGEDENYFFPPLEMLSVLNDMNMANIYPEVFIAGILYHTVEDTGATLEMISNIFGMEVADLVGDHLKNLSLGWEIAADKQIEELKGADIRIKILTLADMLVKEKWLLSQLNADGDEAWNQQAVPKELLCHYFSRIQDELYDLQFDEVTSSVYWKMVEGFKDLFVSFFFDRENQRMIQVSADGEAFAIQKDNMQGEPWTEPIPDNAVLVGRRYAERIEDNWSEEYDQKQRADGYSFEEYYIAIKSHLRGFLQSISERDLDKLMIANIDFIKLRYDADVSRLLDGEMPPDLFKSEGPAMTADALEKLVGTGGSIYERHLRAKE